MNAALVGGGGDGCASQDGRGGMYKGRRGGRGKVARRRRRWRMGCAKGATVQRKVARSRQDVAEADGRVPHEEEEGRRSWAARAIASRAGPSPQGTHTCRGLSAVAFGLIKKSYYELVRALDFMLQAQKQSVCRHHPPSLPSRGAPISEMKVEVLVEAVEMQRTAKRRKLRTPHRPRKREVPWRPSRE